MEWLAARAFPPKRFPVPFMGGRHGFDGGKDSWDACRAIHRLVNPVEHNVTANTQLPLAA